MAVVTIAESPPDILLRVSGVRGTQRLVHRLASLGLVPGARVTVIRRNGVFVVGIGDGRVALGRDAASSVEVDLPES